MNTPKRVIETTLVLLPVIPLLSGLVTGTLGVTPTGFLPLAGIAGLAVWVWTQHWGAYLALLAVGIVCLFAQGLIALAFWVVGVLYITIALVNLVAVMVRNRRNHRPTQS